jgi:hypothetical protein
VSPAHTKAIYYGWALDKYLFNRKNYILFCFNFVLNGYNIYGSDVDDSITAPQTNSPPPIILQIIFIDSAVEGLTFARQSIRYNKVARTFLIYRG